MTRNEKEPSNLAPCWSCDRNPYSHQGLEVAKEATNPKDLARYCSVYPCKKLKSEWFSSQPYGKPFRRQMANGLTEQFVICSRCGMAVPYDDQVMIDHSQSRHSKP